jgi:pimeloyl-ACP methyl ester carboxylesterase
MANLAFAHANSFPSASYRGLLSALGEHHNVVAYPMFGHNPQYPVSDGWPNLVLEYEAFLRAQCEAGQPEPRWLIGHSMGGYLSLMLAQISPGLVSGVILLDAPIVGGFKARLVQMGKATGLAWKLSPARFSIGRREEFESAHQAFNHFRGKKVFAHFSDDALRDYVDAGLTPTKEDMTLAFNRRIESRIYVSLPHHLPQVLRKIRGKRPDFKIAFVAGDQSEEMRLVGVKAQQAYMPRHLIHTLRGTHLFPLEHPLETAAAIDRLLGQM